MVREFMELDDLEVFQRVAQQSSLVIRRDPFLFAQYFAMMFFIDLAKLASNTSPRSKAPRSSVRGSETVKMGRENLWWAGRDLNSRPFGYQPNASAVFLHSSHAELPAQTNEK